MTLNHRLDQNRRSAHARIEWFDRSVDGIRADSFLSSEGKQDRIAHEYLVARRDVEALRANEVQMVHVRKTELERALFGWHGTEDPALLNARRASNEMADSLADPHDALVAYNTAKTRNDELHVHAIFARALDSGWQAIVADYLSEHPGREAEVQELAAIHQLLDDSNQFLVSMNYQLMKPNELSSVSLGEYERELTEAESDVQAGFSRQLRRV